MPPSLDPLFHPASVVVLGASGTAGHVGNIVMKNLLHGEFGGVVYPVNPKRRAVYGVRCYPSLAEVPEVPDLAIIATHAATVPELTRQCADCGVKGAIILSAGFSELGPEGVFGTDHADETIRAFLHLVQYARNQELLYERPPALPAEWTPDLERVRQILTAVLLPRPAEMFKGLPAHP